MYLFISFFIIDIAFFSSVKNDTIDLLSNALTDVVIIAKNTASGFINTMLIPKLQLNIKEINPISNDCFIECFLLWYASKKTILDTPKHNNIIGTILTIISLSDFFISSNGITYY